MRILTRCAIAMLVLCFATGVAVAQQTTGTLTAGWSMSRKRRSPARQ